MNPFSCIKVCTKCSRVPHNCKRTNNNLSIQAVRKVGLFPSTLPPGTFLDSLCTFSLGRWSSTSKDLGARSSSVFSTRQTKPPTLYLPLFPSCIPQAGIITFSPKTTTHPLTCPPLLASLPACEVALLSPGLRSDRPNIRLAPKLVCHFWPPLPSSSLALLLSLPQHGPLLRCACGLQLKSVKNIRRETGEGRRKDRNTDRRIEEERKRVERYASVLLQLSTGLVERLDGEELFFLIGILSTQLQLYPHPFLEEHLSWILFFYFCSKSESKRPSSETNRLWRYICVLVPVKRDRLFPVLDVYMFALRSLLLVIG